MAAPFRKSRISHNLKEKHHFLTLSLFTFLSQNTKKSSFLPPTSSLFFSSRGDLGGLLGRGRRRLVPRQGLGVDRQAHGVEAVVDVDARAGDLEFVFLSRKKGKKGSEIFFPLEFSSAE